MPARRKSTDAKKLSGTLRKGRMPPSTFGRLRAVPSAPTRLSRMARAHWERVGALAVGAGVLTGRDLAALELVAEALETVERATRTLRREGLVLRSGKARKAHPALGALRDARSIALRCLIELALTPRSRGSVDAPITPPADAGESETGAPGWFRFNDGLDEDLADYIAINPSRGRA